MTVELANDARRPFPPAAMNEISSDAAVTEDPGIGDWCPFPFDRNPGPQ